MGIVEEWKTAEVHAERLEREFRRMQIDSMDGRRPPPTAEDLEEMMQARERATVLVHAVAAHYGVLLTDLARDQALPGAPQN